MLIYCDSAILIYFLDSAGSLYQRAANRLAALHSAGDQIAISDLTRLECRVKPIRDGDMPRLIRFDQFFALPDVVHVPLTSRVYDQATELRANYTITTADALHVAAAIVNGCNRLLTHDFRLTKIAGITVELLP